MHPCVAWGRGADTAALQCVGGFMQSESAACWGGQQASGVRTVCRPFLCTLPPPLPQGAVNPPPGNPGRTKEACHSPSRTYYCAFCPHLLKLSSSGGLCIATGLYIINAFPGANGFEQFRGPQATGEVDVSEALQREAASLKARIIFRVAEFAGDCVGCGEGSKALGSHKGHS